jgi:hypothetical protein
MDILGAASPQQIEVSVHYSVLAVTVGLVIMGAVVSIWPPARSGRGRWIWLAAFVFAGCSAFTAFPLRERYDVAAREAALDALRSSAAAAQDSLLNSIDRIGIALGFGGTDTKDPQTAADQIIGWLTPTLNQVEDIPVVKNDDGTETYTETFEVRAYFPPAAMTVRVCSDNVVSFAFSANRIETAPKTSEVVGNCHTVNIQNPYGRYISTTKVKSGAQEPEIQYQFDR